MKKRMIVFGGNIFTSMNYNNGDYEIKKNKVLNKLNEKFDLLNFSNENLTSKKALQYAQIFLKANQFDECILELGSADSKLSTVAEFENNLDKIVTLLFDNNIKPVFVSMPNENKNEEYQNVIDSIVKKYDLSLISFDKNDEASYACVSTEAQFKKAIMNLCL